MKKDRKTRKAEKKAAAAVLKKYVGTTNWRTLGTEGVFLATLMGVGGVIDIAISGGLGTIATVTAVAAGSGGALDMARRVRQLNKIHFVVNKAGQRYEAKELVVTTLNEMEAQLRLAFNRASAPEAPADRKEIFKRLAIEISDDVQKLSPVFTIVAGGPYGYGTEKFELIVGECNHAPGHVEQITLTEAMKNFGQPIATKEEVKVKTLETEIVELKTRIEQIEKPRRLPARIKGLFKKPW